MGGSASADTFQLSEHELDTLKKTFCELDKDSTGALTEEQFRECLGGLGLDAGLSSILFKLFDRDHDGEVSLQEFLGAISLMVHGSLRDKLSFSFDIYDKDNSGVIKLNELRGVVKAMHQAQVSICPATTIPISDDQLQVQTQAFFDALDTDSNGEISREEYISGAIRHPQLFTSLGYTAPVEGATVLPEGEWWEQMVDDATALFVPREATLGERVYFGHPALNVVLLVMTSICTVLQPEVPTDEQLGEHLLTDTDKCLREKATPTFTRAHSAAFCTSEIPSPTGSAPEGIWGAAQDPLATDDFTDEREWKLPGLNHGLNQEPIRVIEHGPIVFQRIRSLLGVDVRQLLEALGIQQLLGNLLMGDCTTLRAGLSEAKSGSFFFETHDSKYILKTIGDEEVDMLLLNLESYWYHLEANPSTLLSHFFGLYDIWAPALGTAHEPLRLRLVLMNNVLYHPNLVKQADARYDLKGAKFLRATGHVEEKGNLLLDKDRDELGRRLQFGSVREGFLQQLDADTSWLASCGLYDYSLLVGIYKDDQMIKDGKLYKESLERDQVPGAGAYRVVVAPDESACYLLGVIDMLTEYDISRKIQRTFQTIVTLGMTELSAAPPELYAARLHTYVSGIVD